MGVIIGDSPKTQFSYLEYQALLFILAAFMCLCLFVVEVSLTRFQVLPLLFPGMFAVRDRRFLFFGFDVSDGVLGKKIRGGAKMLVRLTLCVVLSYLWKMCVVETKQSFGTDFPTTECNDGGWDCFASDLHFVTMFNRHHFPIDCAGPRKDFENRVVISCISFIQPSATLWLMHLAIAHSVTHLSFRCFELLVWICGNSPRTRMLVGALILISICTMLTLFFTGALLIFTSWLSFVMFFSVPMFLHSVWMTSKALETLLQEDFSKVQHSIETSLNDAFSEMEGDSVMLGAYEDESSKRKDSISKSWSSVHRARQLLANASRRPSRKRLDSRDQESGGQSPRYPVKTTENSEENLEEPRPTIIGEATIGTPDAVCPRAS